MVLIKYALSNFKKYCPDYDKYTNFDHYKNSFYKAKLLLGQYNHQVTEFEFQEQDYLQWLDKQGIQNAYLAQQCWIGTIYQGGNAKQLKNCIICDTSFKGRVDSKFCSNVCRSKNYRKVQKEVRKQKRITEAIEFAKFVGIDEPNDKIINYINGKAKWQRDDLLSINPKHERYKMENREYKKLCGEERRPERRIAGCKDKFEKLLY